MRIVNGKVPIYKKFQSCTDPRVVMMREVERVVEGIPRFTYSSAAFSSEQNNYFFVKSVEFRPKIPQ